MTRDEEVAREIVRKHLWQDFEPQECQPGLYELSVYQDLAAALRSAREEGKNEGLRKRP